MTAPQGQADRGRKGDAKTEAAVWGQKCSTWVKLLCSLSSGSYARSTKRRSLWRLALWNSGSAQTSAAAPVIVLSRWGSFVLRRLCLLECRLRENWTGSERRCSLFPSMRSNTLDQTAQATGYLRSPTASRGSTAFDAVSAGRLDVHDHRAAGLVLASVSGEFSPPCRPRSRIIATASESPDLDAQYLGAGAWQREQILGCLRCLRPQLLAESGATASGLRGPRHRRAVERGLASGARPSLLLRLLGSACLRSRPAPRRAVHHVLLRHRPPRSPAASRAASWLVNPCQRTTLPSRTVHTAQSGPQLISAPLCFPRPRKLAEINTWSPAS